MVDYSTYRFLKAERHNKVLKLSFNRPEHLNAVHSELHATPSSLRSLAMSAVTVKLRRCY